MKKRILILFLAIISVVTLTSCKKFTVTFKSDDQVVKTETVKKGKTVAKPADPVKDGYDFTGWFLDGKEYDFGTPVTSDITLVAKWASNKVTVSFNSNWGTSVANINVNEGSPVNKPTDPTRPGYTFDGWYVGDTKYDFSQPVNSNITLKAKWRIDYGAGDFCHVELILHSDPNEIGKVVFDCDTDLDVLKGDILNFTVIPTMPNYNFKSWRDDKGNIFNMNTTVVDKDMKLTASWKSSAYQPKWTPNQLSGWHGNATNFKILVNPVYEYDPFDPLYTANDKAIKQRQQNLVEAAYGIKIIWTNYDGSAPWGQARVDHIKDHMTGKDSFANQEVYVIQIASSWIPAFVKEGCIAELATITGSGEITGGIFTEVGYSQVGDTYVKGTYAQNPTNNQVTAVNNKVYGYISGPARPDHFMYYNADLIKAAGQPDPAELWLRGEWTWSRFKQLCQDLQTYHAAENIKPLTLSYPEFAIGLNAARGNKIATTEPQLLLKSDALINTFNDIKSLAPYYDGGAGTSDVYNTFLQGTTIFQHGALWFIGASNRFGNPTFTIGSVPYPMNDDDIATPITTTNRNEAILGNNGAPLEVSDGVYIKGVDLSQAKFTVPYGSSSCFSVLNQQSASGITSKVAFSIIYDLMDGLGEDRLLGGLLVESCTGGVWSLRTQ